MKKSNFRLFVLLSISVVAIGIFVVLSNQRASGAAMSSDWPGFELQYADWGQSRGINSSGGSVRVKLTYTNKTQWRSEILADSTVPESSGSYTELSPSALSSYNAMTKQSSSIAISPSESLYAADDWLIPGRIAKWREAYAPTITPTETDGIVQMSYTEQIPCDPEISKCETSAYEVVTQIKYWADYDIPMEMTITRDGQLRRRVIVTDFKWLSASNK